jgi:ABC-type glutathione transport system ATPase component
MEPLLLVNDLEISFGEFDAVRKISFTVAEGATTAIVGESGSGKSLTALSSLSLLPPKATVKGELLFKRKNVP